MSDVRRLALLTPLLCLAPVPWAAQTTGTLSGRVVLQGPNTPLHHATVLIVQLRRSTETGDDGRYEFRNVPSGKYDLVAHMHAMSDARRTVEVAPGSETAVDFSLRLATVHAEITVTASGREETTLEAMQSVTALDTLELATRPASSLGEVLENQTGVAKRSFGPGTSRPVIRGFDGDRVLVLQDGIRTGTLSSQSGDHGEPVDPTTLERIEVVRGPATLLYGSNAIGGVVNVISGHHQVHQHPHEGLRGSFTADAGSANALGGASAGVEYGRRNWLFWGDGGGHRTGDYNTPIGRIENSKTRLSHASGGLGRYGERVFFSLGYGLSDGRYGVPFASQFHAPEERGGEAEPVDLAFRRHNLRFNSGVKNPAASLENFQLSLNYTDWSHREIEAGQVGTQFFNKHFICRGVFDQRNNGRFSGSFGLWGMLRDYAARGDETLAPPVDQNAFALFGLEQVNLRAVRLQFGGRLEHNSYNPEQLRSRSFTGFSAGAGLHVPLWSGGAVVGNYTHSYRAPALEELYNRGPHIGNLTFELGDAGLRGERSDGIDLAVRHHRTWLRAETNLFYYRLRDFVYLAPPGDFQNNLIEAAYQQADSRYMGAEARLDARLHPNVWLNLGMDAVDAQLTVTGTPLPRIPPVRGRAGLDFRSGGLSVRPELVLSNAQHQLFHTETPTAGFAVMNLAASYTLSRQHFIHVFSVTLFNAADRLYRNHLSFIKELAPEIGRGVRFTYTVRFF